MATTLMNRLFGFNWPSPTQKRTKPNTGVTPTDSTATKAPKPVGSTLLTAAPTPPRSTLLGQ